MAGSGTEVGALYYDLTIEDKKLGAQLDNADKKVKDLGGNVENTGEQLKSSMNKVAAGLAVAGAGLSLISKDATQFTVDLVKDSARLGREIGVSTEEASRLTAAFGRMGVDAGKASQIFGTFSKQIVASTENAKKTADAFSKIGVSTTDAAGKQRDFSTILFEVADRFKALPNGIDKTALAMELFGRQGKDMINILNQGSGGIQDLMRQADAMGLTLNAQTIGNVAQYIESQKKLKEQTDALKISIGTATTPVLTDFQLGLANTIQSLLNTDGAVGTTTTYYLAFGGPVLAGASAIIALTANMVTAWPAIMAVGSAIFSLTALSIAGWVALIVADLYLIVKAAQAVIGALNAIESAKAAQRGLESSNAVVRNNLDNLVRNGTPAQKAAAQKAINAGVGRNASGTDNWRGGLTWVNEKGPELIDLPEGTRIIPHGLSKEIVRNENNRGGDTYVSIGQVNDRSDADYIINRINRNQQRVNMGMSQG